jgi:imidazole glycerol-phosphate synthase subunit HisH
MSEPPIHVVDYGAGNILSVANALWRAGSRPIVVRTPEELRDAERVVLPGVGAAGAAMARLRETGLADALDERRKRACPILGICVGMQVMARTLNEFGAHSGLNWIEGSIDPIELGASGAYRVPNMGWREIQPTRDTGFFGTKPRDRFFYFCHSYCLAGSHAAGVATVEHGATMTCALQFDTVFACQFHPEKSQIAGQTLLENFVAWRP